MQEKDRQHNQSDKTFNKEPWENSDKNLMEERFQLFSGERLWQSCARFPDGPRKMAALEEAIRKADRAGEPYWQLRFRWDYAYQATFRDVPAKAIAVSREFCEIFKAHPDAMGDSGPAACLMICEMGIDPMVAMPEVTVEEWRRDMERFWQLVRRYGMGYRNWYWQACQFYIHVDFRKAKECFALFWNAGRDNLSDCEACEHSHAVWMKLLMGESAQADALARPVLEGRLTCSNALQSTWYAYLEDALNRGELTAVGDYAEGLYQKGRRDPEDLSYIGALLRYFAFTDLKRGGLLLSAHLGWAFTSWSGRMQFDFYKGAWIFCKKAAEKGSELFLELPKDFPLYQRRDCYSAAELAEWFYEKAVGLGAQFDQRNGTSWFSENLQRAAGQCAAAEV